MSEVGIRFEGLRALVDGLRKSGLSGTMRPGGVVASTPVPHFRSAQWKADFPQRECEAKIQTVGTPNGASHIASDKMGCGSRWLPGLTCRG